MGLQKLRELTLSLTDKEKGFLKLTESSLICLEEFLLFLAVNPSTLSQFKTFVQGLKGMTTAAVAALQLLVTQLDLQVQLATALIQPFKSFIDQTRGQSRTFGFDQFQSCPLAQQVKGFGEKIAKGLKDKITVKPPGTTGPFINGVKGAVGYVRQKEFEIFEKRSYIQRLNAKVNEIKAMDKFFDMIIEAIDDQFTV